MEKNVFIISVLCKKTIVMFNVTAHVTNHFPMRTERAQTEADATRIGLTEGYSRCPAEQGWKVSTNVLQVT